MRTYRVKATFPDGTVSRWSAIAESSTAVAIAAIKAVHGKASVFVEPAR